MDLCVCVCVFASEIDCKCWCYCIHYVWSTNWLWTWLKYSLRSINNIIIIIPMQTLIDTVSCFCCSRSLARCFVNKNYLSFFDVLMVLSQILRTIFPPFKWELGPGKKSQTKIVSIRLKQVAFVFWRYDAGGGKGWEGCRVRWNQLPGYLRGISSNIKDPFAILGNFGLLSRLMQILALFSLSHSTRRITRSLSLFGGHCLNLRTFYHFYYSRLFPYIQIKTYY